MELYKCTESRIAYPYIIYCTAAAAVIAMERKQSSVKEDYRIGKSFGGTHSSRRSASSSRFYREDRDARKSFFSPRIRQQSIWRQ